MLLAVPWYGFSGDQAENTTLMLTFAGLNLKIHWSEQPMRATWAGRAVGGVWILATAQPSGSDLLKEERKKFKTASLQYFAKGQ